MRAEMWLWIEASFSCCNFTLPNAFQEAVTTLFTRRKSKWKSMNTIRWESVIAFDDVVDDDDDDYGIWENVPGAVSVWKYMCWRVRVFGVRNASRWVCVVLLCVCVWIDRMHSKCVHVFLYVYVCLANIMYRFKYKLTICLFCWFSTLQ